MWEFRQEAHKNILGDEKLKTEWRRSEWIQLQKKQTSSQFKSQHKINILWKIVHNYYDMTKHMLKLSGAYPRADHFSKRDLWLWINPLAPFFGFHPFPKLARISKYPSLDCVCPQHLFIIIWYILEFIYIYIYHFDIIIHIIVWHIWSLYDINPHLDYPQCSILLPHLFVFCTLWILLVTNITMEKSPCYLAG